MLSLGDGHLHTCPECRASFKSESQLMSHRWVFERLVMFFGPSFPSIRSGLFTGMTDVLFDCQLRWKGMSGENLSCRDVS